MALNWKVISPHTARAYGIASRDFETVTGIPAARADAASIAIWEASLRARLSTNAIRTYLSAVSAMSGVKVRLPRREQATVRTLSVEEVRMLMSTVQKSDERLLLARLFTLGAHVLTNPIPESDFLAHFIGVEKNQEFSAQRVSRLLKRHARLARLNESQVNLRAWVMSGRSLRRTLSALELSRLLEARTQDVNEAIVRTAFHGIGRRNRRLVKV